LDAFTTKGAKVRALPVRANVVPVIVATTAARRFANDEANRDPVLE
jgi:hypothetical protein